MAQDETVARGKSALDARVETQTLYLMEMMRRLGVSRGAAWDEAERAAQTDAEALCAACPEQAACAALQAAEAALDAPPAFCGNADYVRAHLAGRRAH
ncbi:DUF6455 family protein [Salinarimonas sp.]|uniref:DUF6455 family protein n=1 Tax=Salinarimonas sp. TaxID=2766526 RepID=UPI0032D8EBFD